LSLFFTSCRSVRLLNDDQVLVTRVSLEGIDSRHEENASEYIQKDIRPNSAINLFIYNFANSKNGEYRTDKVRNVGEAPHLLDSSLVEISRTQIQRFLETKGYFNAHVRDSIAIRKKKAHITFLIDQGDPFYIRNFGWQISDTAVERLYSDWAPQLSRLRAGKQYDSDSLVYERENLYNLARKSGYFAFVRQYVRFEVDSNMSGNLVDLKLIIENPENRDHHRLYSIDSSFVEIRNSDGSLTDNPETDTLANAMYFTDYSKKFKSRPINRYIYQRQGDLFNIEFENLTYDRLYELNTFKSIKTNYTLSDSTSVNINYELIPLKRMSNRIEGEYTFNSGRSGFNVGNTYTNRNLFGGSEQLDVKLQYGVLFDSQLEGNLFDRVHNRDLQFGATLSIPRLIVPFRIPLIGKNGMPRTVFSTSWQIFDQINAYSNRYSTNSISYIWNETRYKVHQLTPILLEYRVGRLDETFKEQLDRQGYRLYIESNDRAYIGLGSQYSYTFNNLRLNSLDNFLYFRGTLDVSGNSLSLLSSVFDFKKNESGEKTLLGVPYLQYTKVETDFRWYRHLGGERQLVLRLNPGVAVPYGNNQNILIFEKNFYAGGMNGIRAWQARTLGPGGYNRSVLPDSLRLNLRNLDQLGEIKFEANAEYRFKIMNNFFGAKLKGATFVDAGNIWRIKDDGLNPEGLFKWNNFFEQMAIGAGFGFRFDLDYFVFRLDVAAKVRDPQFASGERWVISEIFNSKDFNQRYLETNFPDKYNFIQYNFGIGLPF